MRFIPIILSLLLIGCASPHVESSLQPVSLGGTKIDLVDAEAHLSKLTTEVSDVQKTGSLPEDSRIKAALGEAGIIGGLIGGAKTKLDEAQKQIDLQAQKMNEIIKDYNYIQMKYQEAVKLLWKWRIIAISVVALTAAFFIFRTWLKVHLPFLPI